MCVNEKISWISLGVGIVGVIICILFNLNNSLVVCLALAAAWGLIMQLADALVWRVHTGKMPARCLPSLSKFTYLSNVLQPVVLIVLLTAFGKTEAVFKGVAIVANLMYISLILFYTEVSPVMTNRCHHLKYAWWTPWTSLMYVVVLHFSCLLLICPLLMKIGVTAWFALSFFFSFIFYRSSTASMWCLFASLTPYVVLALSLLCK